MNPIIKQPWTSDNPTRWGIRGMDDFSAEELVQLQQKVEEWIRQRGPHSKNKRQRTPFVMKQRRVGPA